MPPLREEEEERENEATPPGEGKWAEIRKEDGKKKEKRKVKRKKEGKDK
jgi:hypothetical protein